MDDPTCLHVITATNTARTDPLLCYATPAEEALLRITASSFLSMVLDAHPDLRAQIDEAIGHLHVHAHARCRQYGTDRIEIRSHRPPHLLLTIWEFPHA